MIIYLLNALSIPLYGKFIKNKTKLVCIIGIQMFLILALRSEALGVDLGTYKIGFDYLSGLGFGEMVSKLKLFSAVSLAPPAYYESGFVVINWLASHIGLNYHSFLVVLAAMNMTFFSIFIYRYSKIPWLSFFLLSTLGMYTYCFGILRQSLAVSILLMAVPSLLNKKWWKFIILFFIAFEMHRASVIFLAFVPFAIFDIPIRKKDFKWIAAAWAVLVAILALAGNKLIKFVLGLWGKESYAMSFSFNLLIAEMFLIAAVLYVFVDFNIFKTKVEKLVFWAFILAVTFEIFGMCSDVLARAVEFYYIFVILLIPLAIDTFPEQGLLKAGKKEIHFSGAKLVKLTYIGLIVLLTGFLAYSLYGTILVPYKTDLSAFAIDVNITM